MSIGVYQHINQNCLMLPNKNWTQDLY